MEETQTPPVAKEWWQSKTLWFNVGTLLVAIGSGQLGMDIPEDVTRWALIIGNIVLRVNTDSAVTVPTLFSMLRRK
jgi:hypothetical protein